ncbi:calcium-binding protein [Streptococcus pasteurianus]|uniref:calcium-binding protein n=1 Tax=Streptococcus TaxID=1301 RepID=UPI000E3F6EFE|nr:MULTISPECIES: calcium-binding protein [Streptococcus]MCO7181870.1 calcium-binding protein [Streptococcus gallolyticus]MDV5116235.1 calcium-binding protein [Streptococcus pasteurianus]MDV5154260.1 calcium-binding protein [Streptococcus pasteurianus]MDV5163118.1 calcium-binding protein [Streptococcus pasteurianus]RGC03365.1 calcium-binding protein [Streptococcus pasteurianus]
MNPKTIYAKDSDQDGLTDAQELAIGINPYAIDTDGDGQADLEELQSGRSPLVPQKELCDGLEL